MVDSKYMARQSMGKDLPIFKGTTCDWILFERMFRQTTEACGFSAAENMLRLQKCFQGDALEAVRALLTTTNVEKVMDVLKRRFGRADYIIEDLMNRVANLPSVKEDRPITMIKFAETVSNLVATIESLDQPNYLLNPILVRQLVSKLPASARMGWGKYTTKRPSVAGLYEFAMWIEDEADAASAIYVPPPPDKDKHDRRVLSLQEVEKCSYCGNKSHQTETCAGFLKLSVDARWEWVRKKRVCFGCFSTDHNIRQCKRRTCNQSGCKLKHNSLLHNDFLKRQRHEDSEGKVRVTEKINEDVTERVNCTHKKDKRVYLRIIPVTLKGPADEINTYAILDGGSTVSLISEEIADQLGLKGPRQPLIASWYDDTIKEIVQTYTSRSVSLEIRGYGYETYSIRNARTTRMKMPGQSMTIDSRKWPHLRELEIPELKNATPTIMIGEDNLHLKRILRQVTGKVGKPFASLTPLRWMVHGPDVYERAEREFTFFVHRSDEETELNEFIRDFWSTESFGVTPSRKTMISVEDQRARDLLNKTLRRVGDRWEVGLLWRTDNEELPESRKNAEKRLLSIERKMSRDPEFGRKYSANIQAYIDKSYARKLTDEQARSESTKTWYLPHFAANNPQKPEKLRMVFDAAAKNRGLSLNDRLLKGPDLLNSLPGVLFKFRERKVAICGDLREMFHQVRIREEDCSSQRFLWREPGSKKICTMKMTVMILGAISSPYVAQEVKNRNAEEFRKSHPEAFDAIVRRHYMDDYLDSLDTPEEAIRRIEDVTHVHKKGGFEIRNLMTSSPEVRKALKPEILAQRGTNFTPTEENYTRVLGVNWTLETDSFLFMPIFPKLDKKVVMGMKRLPKREVLKLLMSIFDPLGLLAVLTIRAKILLQDIWRQGTGWDEQLTDELSEVWNTWLQDLHHAQMLRIPRCYSQATGQWTNAQLHVFCDASIQAFAAVAYFRLEGENGIKTALVMAKTRVALIKLLTVPRLELQSAVMATRLALFIKKEHTLQISKTVFWSDSQTALGWIRSDARKYHPFVAHRIAEILDSTSPADWRWVPTKENVADEATRNKGNEKLQNSNRWFIGPAFLGQSEDKWPIQKLAERQNHEVTQEMKKEFCFIAIIQPHLVNSSRFSSWQKMTRVMAWILRFVDNCRSKIKPCSTWELTGWEIERAEARILQQSQQESFPEDWKRLKNGQGISSTSRILTLSPVFKNRLIRMDGRVVNSDKTGLQPIILDSKNDIVKLLIRFYHQKANHNGRERVINDLREKFWITNIRMAVRSSWNDCLECKHRRAKPAVPRMAPLPATRVHSHVAAFTYTGIEYFGPMKVTISRRREKRYGVLFTCLTVRAVHLEIAAFLDTDSMIMALRRMMARRGKPQRIYSDNGTNLRGAAQELRKAVESLDENDILRRTASEKIEWHFIPSGSPHMGGCWERLIGSVKRALKITLKEQAPKEEVLQTLFAEAEMIHVSDDPSDHRSLTPNDFLNIIPSGVQEAHGTLGVLTDADALRRQWRFSQCLANKFWSRWIKEYLPSINWRTKWHREQRKLKVDDLVIIWDENAPRNQWKRGRVILLHSGRDGRIRVADVTTAIGTFRRPVAKLCVLEIK